MRRVQEPVRAWHDPARCGGGRRAGLSRRRLPARGPWSGRARGSAPRRVAANRQSSAMKKAAQGMRLFKRKGAGASAPACEPAAAPSESSHDDESMMEAEPTSPKVKTGHAPSVTANVAAYEWIKRNPAAGPAPFTASTAAAVWETAVAASAARHDETSHPAPAPPTMLDVEVMRLQKGLVFQSPVQHETRLERE